MPINLFYLKVLVLIIVIVIYHHCALNIQVKCYQCNLSQRNPEGHLFTQVCDQQSIHVCTGCTCNIILYTCTCMYWLYLQYYIVYMYMYVLVVLAILYCIGIFCSNKLKKLYIQKHFVHKPYVHNILMSEFCTN